jgi:hypothetical protein
VALASALDVLTLDRTPVAMRGRWEHELRGVLQIIGLLIDRLTPLSDPDPAHVLTFRAPDWGGGIGECTRCYRRMDIFEWAVTHCPGRPA